MPPLSKKQKDFIDLHLGGSPERKAIFEKSGAEASALIEVAKRDEKAAAKSLTRVAEKTGGEMVGLENSVKSQKSLTRKIFNRAEQKGQPPEYIAKNINDVLRYTTIFEPDKYVAGVKATVAELFAAGHKTKNPPKNTWGEKDGYMGINAIFVSPDGAVFELQFHTPKSFWAKEEGTHDLYEEQRD
ncbi:MAG: hypothetical protein AAF727_14375, partial [Pseudomonadota bacterium]